MKRVLVIRLSSMGDVVLAAPVFSHLCNSFPGIQIHFLTHERYAPLFEDDARLSSVTPYGAKDAHKMLKALSGQTWDCIVDLQCNRRSRGIIRRFFSSAEVRRLDKLRLNRGLLLWLRWDRYRGTENVVRRYIRAADPSFGPDTPLPQARMQFKGDAAALKHAIAGGSSAAKPWLALAPFAAWKNKQWPMLSYAEVARHFAAKGWQVVILGGPQDREAAGKLCGQIGDQCAVCAGDRSLREIGCLLSGCDLALGNDTGLSHLARAGGVKTGMIFGATTRHFGFFPYGEPAYKVFESRQFCRPCHPHGGNFCWLLSRPCLNKITPHIVINGLEELALRKKME